MYGLEFIKAFKEASRSTRELGIGSLYPTLARMEKSKLVSCHWGDETNGPRRKYYRITPLGKSVLQNTWTFRQALLLHSSENTSDISNATLNDNLEKNDLDKIESI